jgi:hypothetical protein
MSIRWHFNTVRPGDRARESQVEKFFQSDAVNNRANAMIREGIQNSLDAAGDNVVVRVRLTFGTWEPATVPHLWAKYAPGLEEHIKADSRKLTNPPHPDEPLRFIVFEDFETSGLWGEPDQWSIVEGRKNAYFNFFRAEGVSNKEEGERGRHGVGKFVFAAASRVRAMLGFTHRKDDQRELLMGTATLNYHQVGNDKFMPDGWFGVTDPSHSGNTLPIEHDKQYIQEFKHDFRLSRQHEPGLSIVVPWLDETVKEESIIEAAIEGYYYPVMRKLLVIEVRNDAGILTVINAETIRQVLEKRSTDFQHKMRPMLDLTDLCLQSSKFLELKMSPSTTVPKWEKAVLPDDIAATIQQKLDGGELVALKVPIFLKPKDTGRTEHFFQLFLQRDTVGTESMFQYIREGILISNVRPRRSPGIIKAIINIDEGPLATFLGDAENPSHTDWIKEQVKSKYTHAVGTLAFVVECVPELLKLLSQDQKKADPLPMRDLFFLPEDAPQNKLALLKKKKQEQGDDSDPPPSLFPPPKPRAYTLSKLQGGFVIRQGDASVPRPAALDISMAYGRRQGNPFKKYDPADFELERDITIAHGNTVAIKEQKGNRLLLEPLTNQFEVTLQGFDINRDLHIDTRVIKQTADDGEVTDAEEI